MTACLPACLASYPLLSQILFLNLYVPPSAPERTWQASGQGQAIGLPKGGSPRCSVPVSSTRRAASSTSPLMKPSYVGMCKNKPTHVQLCNPMRSREKKSWNIPAAGAQETLSRSLRKRKHYRSRLAHASNFSVCVPYGRGRHAPRLTSRPERASDLHPQAPNTQAVLPACLLSTAFDYYGLNCFDLLGRKMHRKTALF